MSCPVAIQIFLLDTKLRFSFLTFPLLFQIFYYSVVFFYLKAKWLFSSTEVRCLRNKTLVSNRFPEHIWRFSLTAMGRCESSLFAISPLLFAFLIKTFPLLTQCKPKHWSSTNSHSLILTIFPKFFHFIASSFF